MFPYRNEFLLGFANSSLTKCQLAEEGETAYNSLRPRTSKIANFK